MMIQKKRHLSITPTPLALASFALLLAVLWPSFSHAKKVDNVKSDLNEVHQKIESLKKELNASTEAKKDAADELKASELAISQAQKKLYDIKQAHQKNLKTLNQLDKQSNSIAKQLTTQQARLSELLKSQYKHGSKGYTQLVLENQDPSTIVRDLKYYSYIANAHADLISDMQGNLNNIKKVNQETANTLAEVDALKVQQEAEKKALEKQKQEKANVVKSLSNKIAQQRNQISKLKRDEVALSSLVKRLTAIAKKPKAKPKTKIAKSSKKQSEQKQTTAQASNEVDTSQPEEKVTIAKNEVLPTELYSGVSFSSLRGKLRLPVRGDLINRFGSSRAETGVSWKGLFIRSAEGSEVKSIAGGRVVFSDWMRGFGNLLIIDHGQGYMSLYGNNQALLKKTGDEVKGGETIAAVGNTGGNETNGLYYELRKDSVPFDPLKWSQVR
jgi:murein hydrolase activator